MIFNTIILAVFIMDEPGVSSDNIDWNVKNRFFGLQIIGNLELAFASMFTASLTYYYL